MTELEAVCCAGCGREIWTAAGVARRCSRCDALPSPAELVFVASLGTRAQRQDAQRSREAWERDNVIFFHGFADGRAVWSVERPPPDPPPPLDSSVGAAPIDMAADDCGECSIVEVPFPEWL